MFKKKFDLSNSIYNGLTMKNGRLVNNRPDGVSGIQQAVEMNKTLKRGQKISMMAEGIRMGEALSEMDEMMRGKSSCD